MLVSFCFYSSFSLPIFFPSFSRNQLNLNSILGFILAHCVLFHSTTGSSGFFSCHLFRILSSTQPKQRNRLWVFRLHSNDSHSSNFTDGMGIFSQRIVSFHWHAHSLRFYALDFVYFCTLEMCIQLPLYNVPTKIRTLILFLFARCNYTRRILNVGLN